MCKTLIFTCLAQMEESYVLLPPRTNVNPSKQLSYSIYGRESTIFHNSMNETTLISKDDNINLMNHADIGSNVRHLHQLTRYRYFCQISISHNLSIIKHRKNISGVSMFRLFTKDTSTDWNVRWLQISEEPLVIVHDREADDIRHEKRIYSTFIANLQLYKDSYNLQKKQEEYSLVSLVKCQEST